MITEDLIAYIQKKRRENILDTEITSRLANAGWHADDIAEGFRKVAPPIPVIKPIAPPIVKEATPAVPPPIIPLSSSDLTKPKPESVISTPITPAPVVAKPVVPVSTPPTNITSKVPITLVATPSQNIVAKVDVAQSENATSKQVGTEISPKLEILETSVPPAFFSAQSSAEVKPIFKTEENIPKLIPKNRPPGAPARMDGVVKTLPEIAIITTYSRDMIASQANNRQAPPKQKSGTKKLMTIIIIIVILSFVAGALVAFKVGHVSIPSFSFIKKDPKVLVLNTASALSAFQSYTSETHITVSSPSFANIANGLITGNRMTSKDRDSVTVDIDSTLGQDKNSFLSPVLDHTLHIKSSVLQNDINSDLKYDGNMSYISIPDLHALLGENAPPVAVVSIKSDQFDSLLSLFPNQVSDIARKIDVGKMLSDEISFRNLKITSSTFKNFIDSANVTEKEPEDIDGIATYHYQMTVDRQEVKTLLHSIFDKYGSATLSDDEKNNMDEAFGSTSLDNLEVWVGKSDSLVHQYKFQASVPLSKVINLDDKGIAGSGVTLEWQTTFHDFNIPKLLSTPKTSIPMTDFLASITDLKIRNTLSTLKPTTLLLRNAEGVFGKRANPTGSCTNPNPSSLFSPVGHTKGASNALGNIASTMNDLLDMTNGAGSCFSTSTAWAASFPLASDPTSSYCVDSAGTSKTLTTQLKGTICK